jgi:hypothetical protein
MGYVKREIKRLIKEAGGKSRARSAAEDWYNAAINTRSIKEAVIVRTRFQPGKIYVFEYDPITENLPWFDQNPVVLALEQVDGNDLGINLNLLPVILKEQLMDDLYDRMEGQINNNSTGNKNNNATAQNPLRITYDGMKSYLRRYGYDFAIRQYKPNRKRRQAVVSYQNWPQIALCDFIALNGATVRSIRLLFSRR